MKPGNLLYVMVYNVKHLNFLNLLERKRTGEVKKNSQSSDVSKGTVEVHLHG